MPRSSTWSSSAASPARARARRASCSRTSATTVVDNLPPELLDDFLALRDADPPRYRASRSCSTFAPAIRRRRSSRRARRWTAAGDSSRSSSRRATSLVSRFSETRHRHPLQARSGVQASDRRGARAPRRDARAGRPRDRHQRPLHRAAEGTALVARAARQRRRAADRHRHLRLQVRHPARGRPRLRRPLPDQSLLGARPEAALRPARSRSATSSWSSRPPSASWSSWPSCWSSPCPAYRDEGKARLTVALGCTGGYHRSIALAEELADGCGRLPRASIGGVFHRELER